jgi:polysaccharide biosynthesis transport protein
MENIVTTAESIADQIDVFTDELDLVNKQLQNLTESSQTRVSLETRATLLTAQIVELHRELVSLPDDVAVGEIIQPAAFPFSPVSPNHVMNGAFGIVAGLGLGVGLAFLRDRLSERLRSPEEAEAYLEAPVLGVIPRVPTWRRRREPFLATAVQWRSPAAESYRVLRTNLLSAASVAGIKSIAVTSTHAGEGKSSTVANLGVVLAKAGNRVTIVSADLRRPRLHEFFQRESQPGLYEILARRVTISGSLQEISLPTRGLDAGTASLFLLPSGRVPEDPTELITSSMMPEVIKRLEEDSDIVLIDLPPVLPVTDALVVAAITKQVLLVIGPKASSGPALASARNQLDRVGARILGAVMNGPDRSVLPTYY